MNQEFVTVGSYQFLPEAEAARLYLDAEGLNAFLTDAETVAMDWCLANAVGNIKLQVPSNEAEAAATLLEQMQRQRRERQSNAEQSDDPESTTCLSCGALLAENQTECAKCGWSYGVDEDAEQ